MTTGSRALPGAHDNPRAGPDARWLRLPVGARYDVGAIGRVETLIVLLGAVAVFAVYAWSARYWIDLIDEGYFLYLASRVQAGALPYRDFDTYYTPGIFYLYAWAFDLFGLRVEPIRVLMAGVRALWALLLYRLTRRVAPWPFALLPFLAVAAVDGAPVFPEPHPAWFATLATLAAAEAVARHQVGGGRRWLVVAGALAGVAFAFKQNTGAFAALAIGAFLLLRERRRTGRLILVGQGVFALALGGAVTVLLWPGLDGLLAATLWLPVILTLALLVLSAWTRVRAHGWADGLAPLLGDALAAGGAFVAVTLVWLVPLTLALGVAGVPWGLFVGAVNQGALILALDLPSPATRPVLVAAIWLPLGAARLAGRRGALTRPVLLGVLAATVLVWLIPVGAELGEPLVEDPSFYPWLGVLEAQLGTLYLYLPALSAWAGLVMLGAVALRGAPVEPLAWYLLVGTLAVLALYPRVDSLHAMFAGPPLFVVGAWALAWAHRALARRASRAGQALVFASLLVVPLAAVAPHASWRYVTIVHADPRSPTPPAYVELGLERAPVRLPEHIAQSVRGAVEYVQAGTAPGEPFLAYPVVPLFYFLADRPNPTRFNHFIAGALTPADMQQTIDDLERARPRYILWDHSSAHYFKTDRTNRPISDYIWGCYDQVANFTPYLILERRCP